MVKYRQTSDNLAPNTVLRIGLTCNLSKLTRELTLDCMRQVVAYRRM
jgi:hypothetical protein